LNSITSNSFQDSIEKSVESHNQNVGDCGDDL